MCPSCIIVIWFAGGCQSVFVYKLIVGCFIDMKLITGLTSKYKCFIIQLTIDLSWGAAARVCLSSFGMKYRCVILMVECICCDESEPTLV